MALLEQYGLELAALGKRFEFEETERVAIGQAVYDFQHRDFVSRLRWLLRGR